MCANWLPLESNPDVFNEYMKGIGVVNPKVAFCDVFGVDPTLLAMVPRPIRAMILAYPITPLMELKDTEMINNQRDELEEFMTNNNFFYCKQTIPNACGTMALLHALMNNLDHVGDLKEGSPLCLLKTVGMSKGPKERAALIASYSQLSEQHEKASLEGVTENQPADAQIDLHFTCFVRVKDRCVELDGRKPAPVIHGVCSNDEEFATAAARAIQGKIDCDPNSLRFNILALSDSQE